MSTTVLTQPIAEPSPLLKARAAGAFWFLTALTGTLALILIQKAVVSGDAAATAANLLAQETSFRWGLAANLVATVCYVVATLLVYDLLKPVNRNISLLAAFFSLLGCTGGTVTFVFQIAPLVLLRAASSVSEFTIEQFQTLSLLSLRLSGQGSNINFTFFGLHVLLVGCLILRSTFLPRIVGALMVLGGLGWLTLSFTGLLAPQLGRSLAPYLTAAGGLGEITLSLWLLVLGVNVVRWKQQAGAAGQWRSLQLVTGA